MRQPGALLLTAAALCLAAPGHAQAQPQAAAGLVSTLQEDAPGARAGLLVLDAEGETVAALRPDERFMPASVTKLFTVAAGFRWLEELEAMAPQLATIVQAEPDPAGPEGAPPDIALVGRGSPELRDGADCEPVCLSELADRVAERFDRVRDVIGDDTWFPDERWRGGWGWDDLATQYGTAASALVVNDNVLELDVWPGAAGEPIRAQWRDSDAGLYAVDVSDTLTTEESGRLWIERKPGEGVFRLHGVLPVWGGRATLTLGIDDPALVAARRLAALLEARGVTIEGEVRARHRPLAAADEAAFGALHLERVGDGDSLGPVPDPPAVFAPTGAQPLGRPQPGPDFRALLETTAKDSQNLYAELLLRHLGKLSGDGSPADGLVRIYALAEEAGIAVSAMDLNDGAGMSAYNRVSPRATAALLRHAQAQDWGPDFRDSLAVGGVDGTLAYRFGGALEGEIFAKTGTLLGVNALAGYMTGASGALLPFAVFVNDRPITADSANPAIDAALAGIARDN